MRKLFGRVGSYIRGNAARAVFRKPFEMRSESAIVSFSFDDCPRSALLAGGEILKRYKVCATYYVSFGLMNGDSPSGPTFNIDDLEKAISDGHELGCHTFSHCHSWNTPTQEFIDAIERNRAALDEYLPRSRFESISFPISYPRPGIKRVAAEHFKCCRSGGQTINVGVVDLNQLSCYFLEKANGNFAEIRDLIDSAIESRAWLIFATHDVKVNPSPYGCSPDFFEAVVAYTGSAGARLLPVAKALESLRRSGSTR